MVVSLVRMKTIEIRVEREGLQGTYAFSCFGDFVVHKPEGLRVREACEDADVLEFGGAFRKVLCEVFYVAEGGECEVVLEEDYVEDFATDCLGYLNMLSEF